MQVEKYMLESANPVGSGDMRDPIGLTKLEWMAGQGLYSCDLPKMREEDMEDYVKNTVALAALTLKACHDAGTETEGE